MTKLKRRSHKKYNELYRKKKEVARMHYYDGMTFDQIRLQYPELTHKDLEHALNLFGKKSQVNVSFSKHKRDKQIIFDHFFLSMPVRELMEKYNILKEQTIKDIFFDYQMQVMILNALSSTGIHWDQKRESYWKNEFDYASGNPFSGLKYIDVCDEDPEVQKLKVEI